MAIKRVGIVGSGIMGERLAGGNVAIALLANSIATGAGLIVLITILGPISGAHFNPAVTVAEAMTRRFAWKDVAPYVGCQTIGAFAGVAVAHFMFELPVFSASTHARTGWAQWASEFIATFGLLLTIWGSVKHRPAWVPVCVGTYITAAYWFTSSTSFANPAVTLARSASDTFAGILPADAPAFVVAQLVAAGVAAFVCGWLFELAPVTNPTVANAKVSSA